MSVGSRRWRTIPGAVFLLPDEAPRQIAEVTAAALVQASRSTARDHRCRAETARSRRESVRGLLGWICWGDDVDGNLAESQPDRGVVFMPERHIRVQRRMAASTDSVWALFADFPNLASHWSGLRATKAIGDQTGGVGARRRVELKPIGSMDETVTIWEERRRIDTQNLPSASVPFKHAESTLTLEPDAEGTLAMFDYRYVPRGGPLGRLAGPLIDKMLTGTFTDMLAATDEAPARMVASAEPPSFGAPASATHRAVSAGHNLCTPRRVFDRRRPGAVGSCCRMPESVDLHVQGVAVGDHAAEYVLVL